MLQSSSEIEKQLLALIHNFLSEMEAERAILAVTLNASLDRDLGLGSLEKAELLRRIEKEFSVHLPDSLIAKADTVNDLVIAVQHANPPKIRAQTIYTPLPKASIDPSSAKTLIEVLIEFARQEPRRTHIYLQDEEGDEEIITYGHLLQHATAVAKGLVQRGLRAGDTVAIMLPTGSDFFFAFYGVLLAGGVPVPIYPPFRPDQIEDYAKREALILKNAEVRILITFEQAEGLSKILSTFIPSLKEVTTVKLLMTEKGQLPNISINADDGALIQYTSGSTGNPKGVLLTHRNLLANIRAYGKAAGVRATDIVVSWLPLYHDMGLIGTWLGSLYHGVPVTIMSPLSFLTRPERWLWTIHYHRATISAGPNFAYELCISKIDDKDIEGLDLSSWRLAFNGAEAIYPKTLERFAKRFERYGFSAEKFFPVYGLAESAVALTFPPHGRVPRIDKIAREPFETESKAIPFSSSGKNSLEFVCCGKALPEHEIRIIDDEGNILPERQVGNLQFRGPSSMQGYYRNPAATEAIYHEGWWDTGDLAYIADEEVYITGRKKDVIIKAGRNLYPAEIEEIVGQIPGVRRGCVAAFGAKDTERGTEKLVVVAETHEKNSKACEQIIAAITEKITKAITIPPDHVVLAPPKTIPKTSSGKLRRSATQQLYVKGKLQQPGIPAWLQIVKLFLSGQPQRFSRWLAQSSKILYTVYIWAMLSVTVLPLWLSLFFASQRVTAKLSQFWARSILRLVFCPLKVEHAENLTKRQPLIYVSNHASYLDTIVLLAVLPINNIFIGKKELLKAPIINKFIKKLGHITIDRMDFAQSISDTEQIKTVLQQGRSILIFPEATFTYATGLRPFKLGAFKLAVETKIPICPIALQGTRYILRSGSYLLRPGAIKVTVSEPIVPTSDEWSEVIKLRNLSRSEIAKYCGEPTLDLLRAGYEGQP